MSNRSQRDIHTTVSFLTPIVERLYEDEWRMFKRLLKQLKFTKYMKLMLKVNSLVAVRC